MWAIGMPRRSAPALDELAPVLLARFRKRIPHELNLAAVPLLVAHAADELKALEYQIGVRGVGGAVVTDRLDPAGLIRLPHFRAVEPQLAREPQKPRQLVELNIVSLLVHRQEIHEIDVTHVVSAEVVVA